MISEILDLRKQLHQHPEPSGKEEETAKKIKDFIDRHHPTKYLENLGGFGLAAIYQFANEGPTILIRCELDALPIQETNVFSHASKNTGISHKCGHDGHMAIVTSLIFWFKEQTFERGKVILLFQPSEENGEGAKAVLNDKRFEALRPDYCFALHNIPGENEHSIILMEEGFSAEVVSFSVALKGKEAHASDPLSGLNPAITISKIVDSLQALNQYDPTKTFFRILTPVYINLGSKAYGISPGNGELHYTIRSWSSSSMEQLKLEILKIIDAICTSGGVQYDVKWFEYFPASKNDKECTRIIAEAALKNGLDIIKKPHPFRFGEDFGWFSKSYKCGMFGLGAGTSCEPLHSDDYDFPDEILPTGMKMFQTIIYDLLK